MSLVGFCTKCNTGKNLLIDWPSPAASSTSSPTFSCVSITNTCPISQYKPTGIDCVPCNQGLRGKVGCENCTFIDGSYLCTKCMTDFSPLTPVDQNYPCKKICPQN